LYRINQKRTGFIEKEMMGGMISGDWAKTKECTQCGRPSKSALAEAVTSAAGKTPLTVENVQEVAITKGATADEASPGGVGTGEDNNTRQRRGLIRPQQF